MTRVAAASQEAFVLHVRPYRETSAIVDLMTKDHGRVSAVARGVRGPRRKGGESLVPFVKLRTGWTGRSQLRTLTAFEGVEHHWLAGSALYAGLYLNEVMLRLLSSDDPHSELFHGYARSVGQLADGAAIEPLLRWFEKLLLKECGYQLLFDRDADSGEDVNPDGMYYLEPDLGFRPAANGGSASVHRYSGATLLAIAADRFDDLVVRRAAKRIMREAMAPHLGERPLHSRSLFRSGR